MTTHTTSAPVRRAALALALPLLGGLALAGCSAGSAPASAPGAAPSAASAAPTAGADSTGQAPADGALAAAVDTAIAAVPGSALVSVDQEAGGTSWEVVVAEQDGREHEVHTGADGSAVTAGPVTDADDADDLADTAALLRGASVGHADAASAMTGAVAGTVTELALDEDGGRILWEGDVVDASGVTHSVRIDAASGEVVDRSVED
ncbi:PepSY domain-containing protein [Clavibacter michiganensis]|uniref:PepSY domain-containing protein n=1 Tax=Clavibacter michiganensis TaxID=28447 RepID=UPI001BDF9412|nr:PepSY domain-containing protein [Clavibacter michiganensis]MBT1635906.1 PepSY domain-containing protein [Clavibacter michiganensis]